MPTSPGWHPYFACPLGQKRELRVDVPGFSADRLTEDKEFDFGLPAPPHSRVRCELPWVGPFALEFSPRMRHVQLWSQPGKPFVCVEPFWGDAGTVLTPARDEIAPGAAADYWMRIEVG
jgi:galactose mutarotase-like enzyme